MIKYILVCTISMVLLSGCGLNSDGYKKPFVQCTAYEVESPTFGRRYNKCLTYELACVKPLVMRQQRSSNDITCVLSEGSGEVSN